MKIEIWAAAVIHREPRKEDYVGCSYEMASRRAQAICRAAGESGQTVSASLHLAEYVKIMKCLQNEDT